LTSWRGGAHIVGHQNHHETHLQRKGG
jgi:hypothetical protein